MQCLWFSVDWYCDDCNGYEGDDWGRVRRWWVLSVAMCQAGMPAWGAQHTAHCTNNTQYTLTDFRSCRYRLMCRFLSWDIGTCNVWNLPNAQWLHNCTNCTRVVAACDDLRLSGCPGRGQLAILGHWFPYHQCCHHHCYHCYQHCHVTSIIICKIHKTALILRRASLFNLFTQCNTETFTVKETRTKFKRKFHIEWTWVRTWTTRINGELELVARGTEGWATPSNPASN